MNTPTVRITIVIHKCCCNLPWKIEELVMFTITLQCHWVPYSPFSDTREFWRFSPRRVNMDKESVTK